jgi:hypothetical protein
MELSTSRRTDIRSAGKEIPLCSENQKIHYCVGFQVITAASMKMAMSWDYVVL